MNASSANRPLTHRLAVPPLPEGERAPILIFVPRQRQREDRKAVGEGSAESIKQKLSRCRQALKQIQPDGTMPRNREVPENIVQLICGR